MSSRAITDLHPLVQPLARQALANCTRAGLDILVTCTWRSRTEQQDLYDSGRTKPGKIVTNAKPGQSAHNFTMEGRPAALALDIVPMRHGKPVWGLTGNGIDTDPADDERDDLELWQRVRQCFEAAGLASASHWKGDLVEWPHFEHASAKQLMGGV